MKGRARGFEPPNGGATSRCLNHLATPAASFRIYQPVSSILREVLFIHRMRSPASLSFGLLMLGSAGALVVTNPTLSDYSRHAGAELVALATDELCGQQGLPLLLHLVIKDCPGLVAAQEMSLAALVHNHSSRVNLGVMSVFSTDVGGQQLLPGVRFPRYRIRSLGLAGQIVVLEATSDQGGEE